MSLLKNDMRLIVLYLPQFHPIPENDLWWGKGFTEWTNVAKARPLFPGHYQPHVPADLGFYDLRLAETRIAQADLARQYGIGAFCYYHYWFAGRRILERPFNEVLSSGEPDFPFCLCWANETWTGIWHGAADRILLEQTYPGEEDHRNHFASLLPAFTDPRYVKVEGKPVLGLYRPFNMPNYRGTIDFWREMAHRAGLNGLHIVSFQVPPEGFPHDCIDAFVLTRFPRLVTAAWVSRRHPIQYFHKKFLNWLGRPTVFPYAEVSLKLLDHKVENSTNYPCLVPNWDNSPRSGANGLVLRDSTPELFRSQVRKALELVEKVPQANKIIFIKSWNEWAEGNHLEPDLRYGLGFLRVLHEEISKDKATVSTP